MGAIIRINPFLMDRTQNRANIIIHSRLLSDAIIPSRRRKLLPPNTPTNVWILYCFYEDKIVTTTTSLRVLRAQLKLLGIEYKNFVWHWHA